MLHIQKVGRKTILCGLAVCLCLCLLFTGVMLVAFAAENRAATPCAESDCNGTYENGFCTANSAHYQAAEKNADGYYEIGNAGQLYWFAAKVNGGDNAINAKLTADIDVTAKSDFAIGIQAHPFGGVFDGNGHTLTVAISSTAEAAAPFSYAGGATFKNLTISGTVATSEKYAGGFVGSTTGSLTFEKCLSLVTINSTLVGDGTHGGFVGVVNAVDGAGASVTMTDCGFIGAINGEQTTSCGGLFGWLNAKTTVTNSFVAAIYTISNENGNAVARNDKHLTVNNVYYLNLLGGAPSGAIAITADQLTNGELTYKLGSAWKQTLGTDAYPNFSGKTVYGEGFDCTGKPGSYNNDKAGTVPAHKLVNGVCSECGGYEEPTLNSDGYYEIGNAGELEWFSAYVNNGHGNTNAILTADIDLTGITHTPIGVNYSDFAGVFDGKGYTIRNMNFTCAQNGYDGNLTYDYQGLFGVIVDGATVKNFTVYGEIVLAADGQKYIGGAVGLAYSGAKIENVASYVNITDNRGESDTGFENISQIGGVVGQLGNTRNNGTSATAQNCRYYGTIDVNTAASVGGIAGQGVKNSLVQNCVNYGTVGWNYIGHAGGVVGSAQSGTQVKNCINRGKVSIIRNDCIGGVVGYANENVCIENCANYADIEAKKSDIPDESNVYLGGILGYVNNGSFGGLTGCFNYGKVTDRDGAYTYTGAIVGYVNKDTNANVIQNNAYLDTSCSKAYGTIGSTSQPEDTTSATAAQFASGEIAYLLNGSKTDGTQAWYQELTDTSKLDQYPVLSGKTVYYVTNCMNLPAYRNTDETGHNFGSDGTCKDCGCGQITYREYNPETKQFETKVASATSIESAEFNWTTGWYYVKGSVQLGGRRTVYGDVKLILCDGATLTVPNGGICVNEGNTFTVYAQSDETAANLGKLIASAGESYAGIGGDKGTSAGTITIHGGTVEARSESHGAGIGGGGWEGNGGTITIYGGNITADCSSKYGAGIGGGYIGNGGTISIYGGNITADGGELAAGIGGGWEGNGGTITIYGGNITALGSHAKEANSDLHCGGIGSGASESGGTIAIYGGEITADGAFAFSIVPTLNGNFRLSAGEDEWQLKEIPYANRTAYFKQSVAKLTPCTEQTHDVSIYAYVDGDAHAESCKWCGSAFNKAHATDENGLCICGASEHIYLSYNTETARYDTLTVYALPLPSGSAWTSDWYYVQGDVMLDSRVTVSGNVKLILCNGATLTVNGGIQINGSKALAVYAQSLGATVGKLTVQNAASGKVGISGTLTVCGGQIMAYGSSSANAFTGTITFPAESCKVYGGTSRATLAPIDIAASSDACKQHKVLLIVCGTMSGEISADVVWTSMEFTYTDSTWDPAAHSYTGGWTTTGGTVTVTNRGTSALTAQLTFTGAIDGISGTLSKTDMTIAAGASDTAALTLSGKPGTTLDHAALGNITVTLCAPRNGWYYDTTSGSAYLYRDGSPLTGWQTIDGTKYHFAESGTLSGDICDIGGNRYFFGIYGDMLTGWQTDASGNKYYADTSDGHLLTGWQDIAEKTYYFYPTDSNTPYVMATGVVTIGEYGYYFGTDGSMGTGWQRNSDGKRYYADEDGHLLTGLKDIAEKTYYFYPADSDTPYVMATGKVEIEGKSYFFTSAGYLSDGVDGFVTEDGKTYYYIDGEVYKEGWLYLDANGAHDNIGYAIAKYYFDPETGVMQTRWQTLKVGNKTYTYYFDPATGAAVVGRQTIDGKEYAFTASGNRVAAGEYGSMLKQNNTSTWLSCVLPDGSTRVYNFSGDEVQDLSSNPYLTIDADLSIRQGLAVYPNGVAYYVKDDKIDQKREGWIIEEKGIYYIDKSGLPNVVKSGTKTIDGVQYTFDEYYRCQNPPESVLLEYKDTFGKDYEP